jgi:lipoate-protein ligase B
VSALKFHDLKEIPYLECLTLQHALRDQVLEGTHPGALLLLTHPPTYTIGRHGNTQNMLLSQDRLTAIGAELHQVDRGGDITFHGPGQLVGYPILNLGVLGIGVRDFVHKLSALLGRVVAEYEIETHWEEKVPGLWVGNNKLAAFGVHVHRQITTHGFALNLDVKRTWYDYIVPCGLTHRGVTSLKSLLGERAPSMDVLIGCVKKAFEEEFQVEFEYNASGAVL